MGGNNVKSKSFDSKVIWAIVVLSSLVILLASFWFSGQKRWEVDNSSILSPESKIEQYKKKLESNPALNWLKYNLANLYYRQENYKDATQLLKEVLNSSDTFLREKALFNLGNNQFRKAEAEKEKDINQAITLMQESVQYFHEYIDYQRSDRYLQGNTEVDKDGVFNYTLARQRLKILLDKKKQAEEQKEETKAVYQIVQELLKKERELQDQLKQIPKNLLPQKEIEIRNELLKIRKEAQEKLYVLRNKLIKQIAPPNPTQPQAPGKNLPGGGKT